MDNEKFQRHIQHLQKVHDDLDKEIQEQFKQYGNDALVSTLKKKKLQYKDEIENLKRLHALA